MPQLAVPCAHLALGQEGGGLPGAECLLLRMVRA